MSGTLTRYYCKRRYTQNLGPEEQERRRAKQREKYQAKKSAGLLDESLKRQYERASIITAAKIDADQNHPQYKSVENYIRWLRGAELTGEE